jgi:DNA-binding beta-propeller fold protein YncE
MAMILRNHIDLPEHTAADGEGFDHAAYSSRFSRMYVAHTCNNSIDMIDCSTDRFIGTVENLPGVAGVLVSDETGLLFTSNRGEDSIGIATLDGGMGLRKVRVGSRPNGLAFDLKRRILYAANVGESVAIGSYSVTAVDIDRSVVVAEIPVPGRTRWAIYDPGNDVVYINIREPACIAVIECEPPLRVARTIPVDAKGPHGLDLDPDRGRLYCACDDSFMYAIDLATGKVAKTLALSGAPDVIFLNASKRHLYVASGDPGCIDVINVDDWRTIETITTELGAHTIGYDPSRNKVYAFMPETHRAAVFEDR